jgi:hypothetical protein
MTKGYFRTEDYYIVRLDTDPDNDRGDLSRTGWVNVGAFAVRISTNGGGTLTVEVYPQGNEHIAISSVSHKREVAMISGAVDLDEGGPL